MSVGRVKFISVKLHSGVHSQLMPWPSMALVVEERFCISFSLQALDCFAVSHLTLLIATHFSKGRKA